MSKIKLIVGLGNPGRQYAANRHNAGYWLIERLAQENSAVFTRKEKFFAYLSNISLEGNAVHLLKPDTFMNLSGKSVQALASFYRIDVKEILVAHDELDIGCGQVKLKLSGGHGGHNGLRDIMRCLGSPDFYRLRIGISHPGQAHQVTGYVLSNPDELDKKSIDDAIARAIGQIPKIVSGDFEAAMQTLHTKVRP